MTLPCARLTDTTLEFGKIDTYRFIASSACVSNQRNGEIEIMGGLLKMGGEHSTPRVYPGVGARRPFSTRPENISPLFAIANPPGSHFPNLGGGFPYFPQLR